MKATLHPSVPPNTHYTPKRQTGPLSWSVCSGRMQVDLWEATRVVPSWQARAECYPAEPYTPRDDVPRITAEERAAMIANRGERGVSSWALRMAVRDAARELQLWPILLGVERPRILGKSAEIPVDTGVFAHGAA